MEELDKNIDAIFPAWKTVIEKGTAKQRNKSLENIHELLLSGKHEVDKTGKVIFGNMDSELQSSIRSELKGFGGKAKDINNNVLKTIEAIYQKDKQLLKTLADTEITTSNKYQIFGSTIF